MVDINKRVNEYIKIRDEIKKMEKEFEEKIAPYKEAQEKLGKLLLNELNKAKVKSMQTTYGTLYRRSHKSASIVDKDLFWNFVVDNALWELVDKRANAQACADYADEHKAFPPGINYTNYFTAAIRKN